MPAKHRPRRSLAVLTITVALMVAACSGSDDEPEELLSSPESGESSASSAPATSGTPMVTPAACGASELEAMSPRRKLAQLLMVGVTGTDDALDVVEREQVGGIFIGSWTDLSILGDGVGSVQQAADIPVMVSVDQEGGRVSRLSSLGIDSPSARELAQTQTPAQVQELAKSQGQAMKELGITVDYAPVVDVSDAPANDVIGDRSFSNDAETVTTYAEAYAQGLKDAGILPVFKHFPGHGSGSGDSHTGTVATPPLAELKTSDLVPYRTLVGQSGVGVMMGHLIVPGLTGPDTPSSISPAAIALLRAGTGYGAPPFDGPIFTDDLSGMAAISAKYPIEKAATLALSAGADIALWLSTVDVPAVLDSLTAAVDSGELPAGQVDDSVVRVLRAKGVLDC